MYYNMTGFIRLLLLIFLFSNGTTRAKMSNLFRDFCKYMDDAFQRQVGHLYNVRYINDDDNNPPSIEDTKEEKKMEEQEKPKEVKKEVKFEDKYLEKYKAFKNEYYFTEEEKLQEEQKYTELCNIFNKEKEKGLKETGEKLEIIMSIFDKGGKKSPEGIEELMKYYNMEDEYDDDPEHYDLTELMNDLTDTRKATEEEYEEFSNMDFSEEETREAARKHVLDKKLEGFINNYVLESTPQGNVYMRYNSSKNSFEYFSNNTIPYRYLEPVGRKYVLTYFCKPLFIDIEEELKKAQVKKDIENQEKKDKKEQKDKDDKEKGPNGLIVKDKDIFTKLKSYNNDTTSTAIMKSKNRQSGNMPLPPQIQANLPNVNSSGPPEKMLLKECANRYTWEGRMSNLPLIKKVEKKHVDKNYEMSFADFKKMQKR
jgi:hypothetical protein